MNGYRAFLFDEPWSNLDAKLRVQMRTELARLQAQLRTTTVYVTHDQVEAMTLGDRIVVMQDGIIQQIDTPLKVYQYPANRFVASFIGSPGMNFIDGEVSAGVFHAPGVSYPLSRPTDCPGGIHQVSALPTGAVTLGFRPESLSPQDCVPQLAEVKLEVVK